MDHLKVPELMERGRFLCMEEFSECLPSTLSIETNC